MQMSVKSLDIHHTIKHNTFHDLPKRHSVWNQNILTTNGGGAPEATPCISGTMHQKVTTLLEHTYIDKYQGFKA